MRTLQVPIFLTTNSLTIFSQVERYQKHISRSAKCEMLLDTGTSMSTMSRALANRLGYDLKSGKEYNTRLADGSTKTTIRITIPYIILDNY